MELTITFMVIAIAIIIVFDVWTLSYRGYRTTISYVFIKYGKIYPMVPFVTGLLVGHFYWGSDVPECPPCAEVREAAP